MEYEIFFSGAFLIQVLAISAWLPWILRRKFSSLRANYPQSAYPKLYPAGDVWFEARAFRFTLLSALACLTGLFFWVIYNSDPTNSDYAGVVWAVFMLQSLPYVYLEVMTSKVSKLMREADFRRKRQASLSPRSLMDILSSNQLVSLFIFFVAFCGFIYYVDQLNIPHFGGWLNVAILLGSFLFMIGLLRWQLRGRIRDPYMNEADFLALNRRVASQLMLVSHALIVYAVVVISLQAFELDKFKQLAMTFYCQGLMLGHFMLVLRKPPIDFSVYRKTFESGKQVSSVPSPV